MIDILFLLGLIIGMVVGVFVSNVRKSHGLLKIDKTNPDKDSYLFEIDDLSKLEKHRWIRLRIIKRKEFGRVDELPHK